MQSQIDPVYKEMGVKGLLTAAVAAAGSYLLLGESEPMSLPFVNISVPSGLIVGVSCGVGSIAADSLSEYAINMIPQNKSLQRFKSTAVKLGISGLATAAAIKLTSGTDIGNLGPAVMIGVASKACGDCSYDNVYNANRSGFLSTYF